MLFYNHKQEFIGIDEDGLKLLNYNSLEELLGVCSDVADLFAKEPGYIHNFKNFGWIDFLLHADSDATSAIVHANGRTFSCTLHVHKLFLCEAPAQSGFMIEMLHVQTMSGEEIKPHTITPKPAVASKPSAETVPSAAPSATPEISPSFEEALPSEPAPSILPDYAHLTPTPLSEPGILDVPAYEESEFEPFPEPSEPVYEKLTLPEFENEAPFAAEPASAPEQPKPATPLSRGGIRFTPEEQAYINELKVDKSYRFDPSIAANELGLPVDLIQEFIGDFIQQAHDFKDDLFDAALRGDMNNLKILSHKLKGVAANLRIEDAFECLSIINTSEEIIEIEANLKYFYAIVDKLEGKSETASEPNNDSDLSFASEEVFAPALKETQSAAPAIELDSAFAPEDDIYAFALKDAATDEPVAPSPVELPDYSVGLKHDEDSTLLVHEEELSTFADNVPEEKIEDFSFEPVSELSVSEASPAEEPLHYDKSAIAGQLGIEPAFLDELIEDYKRDALRSGQRITDAIGAFDTHLWQAAAKELKGISDNLRLSEISDQLAILSVTNDAQEANKASKRLNGYLNQL